MTDTTTDAAEARAREVLAKHLDASGFAALAKSARGTGLESMVAAMLAFATAEAASGAGERDAGGGAGPARDPRPDRNCGFCGPGWKGAHKYRCPRAHEDNGEGGPVDD